ncbi:hypothetical protein A0J61_04547 [Choanephora cucurbitarum]|uniref:F-box domain-containing protein n=1 Tax=Choanephora cucurbitarum TaxID=101091 RepID=A0A1C7NE77_9FUNG|nr:hypothetical protein A0J61_04547 [Choanephora cucurbitarum]
MASYISKLNDDCLELVFQFCGGCPWTLNTLSRVSRRWYAIANRPSAWRLLVIDKPSLHRAYARFLSSESNQTRLEAVRTLMVAKPIESRHAHLRPLPFSGLTHVTHLYTFNLCLAEIEYVSQQLKSTRMEELVCNHIETWCDMRRFSFDLIQCHPYLRHVQFRFMEDGHSGFASIHNSHRLSGEKQTELSLLPIESLQIVSIRDAECLEQRSLLVVMEEIENDRDEVYSQQDIDRLEHKQHILIESWHLLESALYQKYQFLSCLHQLKHLELGSCYAWAPKVWRYCFKKAIESSPQLKHLGLHGWDQIGRFEKMGSKSSAIEPIRADAESAILECFQSLKELASLELVDFSVGSGLLQAGPLLAPTIQHVRIAYSRSSIRYISEPADVWLLIGPLKEFLISLFSGTTQHKNRWIELQFHSDLIKQIQHNMFFSKEPFLDSLQASLKSQENVHISLSEY